MEGCGFSAQKLEWWHYNPIDGPLQNTYFDFPIA